jgi:TetR/AcrR family tetracycline transcriptional repressor
VSVKPKSNARGTRRSRGSLSEDEILAGAIAVAQRDGLDGLSMPTLAKHLGASAMSVYRYFHSKDDLLAAMSEHLMSEVYSRLPPIGNRPWDEEIVRLMTALSTETQRTPLYAELCQRRPIHLFSRPAVMSAFANRLDEELQVIQRAGLTPDEAIRLHNILFAFTLGFVLLEFGAETKGDEPTQEGALATTVAQLDPGEFPTLRAVSDVGALISVKQSDYDDFVRLLVAGVLSRTTNATDDG